MYNNALDKKAPRKAERTLMPDVAMAFNNRAEKIISSLNAAVLPSFRISSGLFDCYHGDDGLHPCAQESLMEFEVLLNHLCNEARAAKPQPAKVN